MKRVICMLLLSVAACAAPSSDDESSATTDQAYASNSWQALMTCNGGAAALDVDRTERRNVQLVIRDPRVVDYLQSKTQSPMVNAKHEIVITANEQLGHGLFSPRDFGHVTEELANWYFDDCR